MEKKFFTLEEANALLPSVQRDLENLQQAKRQFGLKYSELEKLKSQVSRDGRRENDPCFELECQLEFLQIEARSLVDSIRLKGAELKDIDRGLVDFPALMDGVEVLLCWKQGEAGISYYHGMMDGFTGRKPLNDKQE